MASLPKWLTIREDGAFVINQDMVYPKIIDLIIGAAQREIKTIDPKTKDAQDVQRIALLHGVITAAKDGPDQYLVECAYQCAKLAVQDLITGTELDPRPKKGFIMIMDHGGDKNRWALANLKPGAPGRDVNAATKGLQAKKIWYAAISRQILSE